MFSSYPHSRRTYTEKSSAPIASVRTPIVLADRIAYMNTLRDRITLCLERSGLSQSDLARHLGISSVSVNNWATGATKSIKGDNLLKAASFLRVRPEWLSSGVGQMTYENHDAESQGWIAPDVPAHASPAVYKRPEDLGDGYVWIDQVDAKLSAGDGVVEWIVREERQVAFRENWFKFKRLNQESCKLLSVKGRSMEPELRDGDVVLIDLSDNQPEDGEVYAVNHNGKMFIKQLVHGERGLEMRSFNPEFEPVPIKPTDHFIVLGRKVWRGG